LKRKRRGGIKETKKGSGYLGSEKVDRRRRRVFPEMSSGNRVSFHVGTAQVSCGTRRGEKGGNQ